MLCHLGTFHEEGTLEIHVLTDKGNLAFSLLIADLAF